MYIYNNIDILYIIDSS